MLANGTVLLGNIATGACAIYDVEFYFNTIDLILMRVCPKSTTQTGTSK